MESLAVEMTAETCESEIAHLEACAIDENVFVSEIFDEENLDWNMDLHALMTESSFEIEAMVASANGDPDSFKEARARSDWNRWKEAMDKEYNSLIENMTWEIVDRPKGKKVVGCRWVYKLKRNADGTIERWKARLVAKGFSQVKGESFNEVYAPVAKFNTIKAMIGLATKHKLPIMQYDFETAYLNGDIDAEVYMELPEGYGSRTGGKVVRLRKGLYGLKQAGKLWNDKLNGELLNLGYERAKSDSCVYHMRTEDGGFQALIVYVDDLLAFGTNSKLRDTLMRKLGKTFKMKELGKINWFLGMNFRQSDDNSEVTIDQSQYLKSMLIKFGMEKSKPADTPLVAGVLLTKSDCPNEGSEEMRAMINVPYRSAVGSLMYLLATRPDVRFHVTHVSRFVQNPALTHWKSVKRIFRYLNGTRDYGLKIGGLNAGLMSVLGDKYDPRTDDLIALVDSDWAADNDTRRSCRGYAIYYYGALICAKSKLDSKVSTSSAEAELHAMILLIHEIDWLTTLYKELGEPVRRPVRVFEDNQACIAMIAEPNAFQSRSKYLQLSKYSVAEKVDRSEIGIEWLSTDQMIADAFTKPEPRALLEKFRPSLVIDVTEHWRK